MKPKADARGVTPAPPRDVTTDNPYLDERMPACMPTPVPPRRCAESHNLLRFPTCWRQSSAPALQTTISTTTHSSCGCNLVFRTTPASKGSWGCVASPTHSNMAPYIRLRAHRTASMVGGLLVVPEQTSLRCHQRWSGKLILGDRPEALGCGPSLAQCAPNGPIPGQVLQSCARTCAHAAPTRDTSKRPVLLCDAPHAGSG